MPTNAQLQKIAKNAQIRAANEATQRSDIVRAMCAVVMHYGGKITINDAEIGRITDRHKLVANRNDEVKEITFSVEEVEPPKHNIPPDVEYGPDTTKNPT